MSSNFRHIAKGAASLALAAGLLVSIAMAETIIERRTVTVFDNNPTELVGTVEVEKDPLGDELITIVDDDGLQYYVVGDHNLIELRERIGSRVRVEYVYPTEPRRLMKIRRYEVLDTAPVIERRTHILETHVDHDVADEIADDYQDEIEDIYGDDDD